MALGNHLLHLHFQIYCIEVCKIGWWYFKILPNSLWPFLILYICNLLLFFLIKVSMCLSCSVMPNSLQFQRLKPPGSSVHGDSPGKNTGVGCHALLQGIFLTQGLNPGLPQCRWILSHLSQQESPMISIHLSTLLMFSNYHKFIRSSFLSPSLILPFISSISFLVFSFGLHRGIF